MKRVYLKNLFVFIDYDDGRKVRIPSGDSRYEPLSESVVIHDKETQQSYNVLLTELADEAGTPITNIADAEDYLSGFVGFKSDGGSGGNPSGGTTVQNITVLANDEIKTTITLQQFIEAFGTISEPGPEINPTGTIDPTNVSTTEANMIDGNLTNLTYNNSNAGTVNKELPAIDLGSPQDISQIVLYWWNNTYTASNFKLQGSNDGTNWTDIVSNQNSTGVVGTSNNPQTFDVNVNFQYVRVFCVQGNNASWCVISELEVYEQGNQITKNVHDLDSFEVVEETGCIKFINNGSNDVPLKIVTI